MECNPTAHEERETQWNLMGLTYLLVVYHINSCTYYMCRQQKCIHINDTHTKEVYTTQVQVSMSTVPMQQVCPERAQNASDKQPTMQANLVNGLHIKSTGSHEVLHHGQLPIIGCKVQGCGSVIIRVKEVALHLGGKVLGNGKMAFSGTQEKGISSSLQ